MSSIRQNRAKAVLWGQALLGGDMNLEARVGLFVLFLLLVFSLDLSALHIELVSDV
jgi:hypothetical protein